MLDLPNGIQSSVIWVAADISPASQTLYRVAAASLRRQIRLALYVCQVVRSGQQDRLGVSRAAEKYTSGRSKREPVWVGFSPPAVAVWAFAVWALLIVSFTSTLSFRSMYSHRPKLEH